MLENLRQASCERSMGGFPGRINLIEKPQQPIDATNALACLLSQQPVTSNEYVVGPSCTAQRKTIRK